MHTVEVMFTAQEILVGRADYPTEKIGDNSRKFRQLGIGYANLGAMLMALGLPYDSRRGSCLGRGAHLADDRPRLRHQRPHRQPHGPVRRLRRERSSTCSDVLRMHRDGRTDDRRTPSVPAELLAAGRSRVGRGARRLDELRRAQRAGSACSPPPAPSA